MGLMPKLKSNATFTLKECARCHQSFGPDSFTITKSKFMPSGVLPLCNNCIDDILRQYEFSWDIVDKACQWADIPFIPNQWKKIADMDSSQIFARYAALFQTEEHEKLDWNSYFQEYKELERLGALRDELPLLGDNKRRELKIKWGQNYDDEALNYLETLFNGIMSSQNNVTGTLQIDNALKICKMAYEINNRIEEGADYDKLLSSYDKMVKMAEFTPKNIKNINDFDSVGEVTKWLEKNGWRNKFYDGVTRDIVDATQKNMQSFNQRLYVNETAIGEEITRRLEALRTTAEMENNNDYYELKQDYDLDAFEQEGYNDLLKEDNEEFEVDVGEGSDV